MSNAITRAAVLRSVGSGPNRETYGSTVSRTTALPHTSSFPRNRQRCLIGYSAHTEGSILRHGVRTGRIVLAHMETTAMAKRETVRTEVVRRQLAAMDAQRYEIGVKRADGHMIPRVLTLAGLLGQLRWLERENRQGADIFIRPEGSVGLILVDDVDEVALGRMVADGLTPAVIVETSPLNHQAWVRLSAAPIEPVLASTAARLLADRYDGDPNSAAWRHYGRLAGFTNRKNKHQRPDGTYPLVLLRAATGSMAPAGARFLHAARDRLTAGRAPTASGGGATAHALAAILVPNIDGGDVSPLGLLYRREAEWLLQRYPGADLSKMDWMIILSLARAFTDADGAELARAMVEGSPRLAERKAGHLTDYVARTVAKALAVIAEERRRNGG